MKLQPVHLDGLLWVAVGTLPVIIRGIKDSVPWNILTFEAMLSAATTLKAFRSTSYAQHLSTQNGNGQIATDMPKIPTPIKPAQDAHQPTETK